MFRRIMLTAFVAGTLAGLLAAGMQTLKIAPLILEAEVYEQAAEKPATHDHHADGAAHEHAAPAWEPAPGGERIAYTVAADLLAGIGFALLLVGAIALSGREVGGREGVLWGLAGFAVFTLAPSLGLPPELPGMLAGELVARQGWWALTALATASGLGLLAFSSRTGLKVAALALIVAPHMLGVPMGPSGGAVPPELMARFASASIVIAGLFWVALGGLSGLIYRRMGRV